MTPPSAGDPQPRLAALFATELTDRVARLEEGLLDLEQEDAAGRTALLDELVRAAHTLKGSAGLLGAAAVASICHELEDALERLRRSPNVDAETISGLLADVDRLRTAGEQVVDPALRASGSEGAEPVAPRQQDRMDARSTRGAPAVRLPAHRLDALVGRTASLRVAAGPIVSLADRLHDAQRAIACLAGDATADATRTAATVLADVERAVRPLLRHLGRAVDGVDGAVRDVVTVPVSEACEGLHRQARDIASARGREVELVLELAEVEMDRLAVAGLRDALVHLVRNAVDHGIEAPADRRRAGKSPVGRVEVAATVRGDQVEVTVQDDGRGLDADAVREAAEATGMDADGDVEALVFALGVSTAAATTEISGRGVGLDAVRDGVESLGGTVSVVSEPGNGTTVTLAIPASVATARVLLAETGGHRVAFLLGGIRHLVRVHQDTVVVSDGRAWTGRPEGMVLLAEVADLAGLPTHDPSGSRSIRPGILTGTRGSAVVLVVDRVVAEAEVLLRPVGALVGALSGVVSAGVTGEGQLVLVLHPEVLARQARDRGVDARPFVEGDATPRPRRVLLVDDAPTTLALEKGLLEAAGYEVLTATDGMEAWDLLGAEPVDVVVSDVDMPGLDGIALSERIRTSPALRDLPIVLLTSRDTDADRRRGAEAGADAYLLKSAFAQGDLLDTVGGLLR